MVKDLKDRHESQPELAQIAQLLDSLRAKVDADNTKLQTQITTWKGDVTDRINHLLKLKTPCALTKVDMINAMRAEYDAFRSAQKVLEEQRPIPITAAELKPLHDQYQDICTRLDRMEAMITQSRSDNETAMAKMQQLLENIQRGMDDNSSVSSSRSSHAPAGQRRPSPIAEQRRTSPIAGQRRPSPVAARRRTSQDPNHRSSRQESRRTPRTRSRSRINPSRQYARTPPRRHPTPSREHSPRRILRGDARSPVQRRPLPTTEREYEDELHALEKRIQEINARIEMELRSSSEGALRRLESLRRDKSELKKTKDFYEERLNRIRRATQRDHSERSRSPHVRDQRSSSQRRQWQRPTAWNDYGSQRSSAARGV
ncbi:hypothetical protein ANCCAN_17423 [Ancylostoma caninum]|uniref:Uncharacterized protein n=1 Tax=Ancylostoma caninum TaxID=29170 RepID=A0A368FWX2_ANCCA|nr:hypothetical protein ANCCAN_17423 [Ancylostoma caninum]